MGEKRNIREWPWFLALFGVCVLVGVVLAQWQQRAQAPTAPVVGLVVEAAPASGGEKAAPKLVWIEGRVVGPGGAGLAGAQVRAQRLGRLEAGATAEFVGTTDAEGRFRLGPTRRLGHKVEVSAAGFAEQRLARVVPGGALEVGLVEGGGLRGRVVHEGRGLRDAEVLVGGPGLWPPVEARSGEDGWFVTPPLEAGELQVWVRHPGVGQGSLGALAWVQHGEKQEIAWEQDPDQDALGPQGEIVERLPAAGAAPSEGAGGSVRVEESRGGEDVVEIPVEAAGSLSVRVVSEATGEPVPGALVTLAEDVVHVMALTEWSDGLGKVGFVGLPGARYVATARAYGFVPASQEVRVEAGSGELVVGLAPAAKVGGQVLGPDGGPLELAQVVAHVTTPTGQQWRLSRDTTAQVDKHEAPSGLMAPSMEVAFGFFSDEEGRFVVTGVPGGRVVLEVRAPGFAPGFAGPLEVEAGGWVEAAPVSLEVGRPLRGVVTGPEGEPILGAQVWVGPSDRPSVAEGALERSIVEQVLVTDEQGRFEGLDLPREVEARASAEGFLDAEGRYDLEQQEEEVRLVLGLPGVATRGQVSLEGEVALEGVYVSHVAAPGQAEPRGGACSALTDGSGRFLLAGCPDAPFWVSLEPPGLEVAPSYARLEPGEDAQIALPSAGVVEVKARDVELEPLGGVELVLRSLDAPSWPAWLAQRSEVRGETDFVGVASLEGLAQGRWEVVATREGFQAQRAEVSVGREPVELGLDMEAALEVALVVVDRQQRPIEGARLRVTVPREVKGARVLELVSGPQGRVALTLERVGEVRVEAVHAEEGRGEARWTLEGGEEELTVELGAPTLPSRWRGELEELGVELWDDGLRVVAEGVEPESAAALGGLQRGDLFLGAEARDGGLMVWIEREGEDRRLTIRP